MGSDEKFRRTALRRAVDSRLPAIAKMPISGGRYLVAHACFDCRKSFKVAPRPQQSRCPNCGNQLHWMGRSFKAPAARDREQWAKVQTLYLAGFRFSSYRSHDCAPLPLRLAEVDEFIRNNPEHPFRFGNSE